MSYDLTEFYNWKDVTQLFKALNDSNIGYVVLRNYEEMHTGNFFTGGHEDIDILCEDRDLFITVSHAVPKCRDEDKIHLVVFIGNVGVPIDLRCVGDDYYDSDWEKAIINNHVMAENGNWYVMNEKDYYYSLAYHAIIQKKVFSEEYQLRLNKMSEKLGILAANKEEHINNISEYFKQENYKFVRPKDTSVPFMIEAGGSKEVIPNKSLRDEVRDFCKKIRIYKLVNILTTIKKSCEVRKYKSESDKIFSELLNEKTDAEALNKSIYTLCWNGRPGFVEKACINSFEKKAGNITIISKDNYKEYVKLPEFITKCLDSENVMSEAAEFIISLYIIGNYGGGWINSGVYMDKAFVIPTEALGYYLNGKVIFEKNKNTEYIEVLAKAIAYWKHKGIGADLYLFRNMLKQSKLPGESLFFDKKFNEIYDENEWKSIKQKCQLFECPDYKGLSNINTYYCKLCQGQL